MAIHQYGRSHLTYFNSVHIVELYLYTFVLFCFCFHVITLFARTIMPFSITWTLSVSFSVSACSVHVSKVVGLNHYILNFRTMKLYYHTHFSKITNKDQGALG